MPDIASNYEHLKIKIKDCEYIKNPHLQKDPDDDDEEEDDESPDDGDEEDRELKIM